MFGWGRDKEKDRDKNGNVSKPPVPPKRHVISGGQVVPDSGPINFAAPPTVGARSHMSDDGARSPLSIKEFDIQGLSLPALAVVQVKVRKLVLPKSVNGDFGFTVRRVQYPCGPRGELRTVVFVEPTELRHGPPRPDDIKNGLLPGDELLEIDGRRVSGLSREELHDSVRNAGQQIELVVKAAPELAEFCDRHRGVRDGGDALMLSNVNTNLYEHIPEDQRYWLMHKGGYTMVRLEEMLPDGRARISVANKSLVVDVMDIDRANPQRLDRASDLASLSYVNETGAIHLLRQRTGGNLLYTNAGSQSVLSVASTEGAALAENRLASLFKGCRRGHMPAHIYATAQQVYRNVQTSGNAQAVVLTGASGSGKTTQLRALVRYLSNVAGWTKSLPFDRLAQVFGILEAFGHCSTPFHANSTRFVYLFSLGFDKSAALKSLRVQMGLLEADRVMSRNPGASIFHVFYYLFEGADQALKQKLKLDSIPLQTLTPYQKSAEKEKASEAWHYLCAACRELGIADSQLTVIWSVLAAVLHLHAAGSTPGPASKAMFVRQTHAETAASLLGVSVDDLSGAVFRGKAPTAQKMFSNSISRLAITARGPDGPESLNAFGAALYSELFTIIVDHINKHLSSPSAYHWISILDIPGSTYHAGWVDGWKGALGLNHLVYNYVNERVHELFYDDSFTEPQEVYTREQVDVTVEAPLKKPHDLTRLLDQRQQLLASTDIDERAEERRGILAILEEESMFPGATDDSLLERIFVHLGEESKLLRRGGQRQIMLSHARGAYDTAYSVDGWVKHAQPCESSGAVRPLLATSKIVPIAELFGSHGIPADSSRLRRATQVAQLDMATKRVPPGFLAGISSQMEYVLSTLRRVPRSHFVHCIQPTPAMRTAVDSFDVPFVRCQLRTIQLIDSVRASNRGYPERVSFRDFRRRFGCLVSEDDNLDDRVAVGRILDAMDVHQHRFRLGISQVLLASDLLVELEDRRELCLTGIITALQHECRRHLASKWLQKRRTLDSAIRCIQRNGLVYHRVSKWPWWRLYTKVLPLLAVARTDVDPTEWARRVGELEKQVGELRIAKQKAERRANELEEGLAQHLQASNELSQELQRETEARVHVERRLQAARESGALSDTVSRVSSSPKLNGDEAFKVELATVREKEEQARVKAQRAIQQLQDVEAELHRVKARNEILEKKQERFDTDLRQAEEKHKEEAAKRDLVERERDEHKNVFAKKVSELQSVKSENVELRASLSKLRREIEEKDSQAGGEELAAVQKSRRELEQKVKDQEDQLDEVETQNQQLQQTVLRLEMAAERLKADLSRETSSRETEIDELRAQYQRRIRGMEDQLADANDKYQNLIAENRLLEARTSRQSRDTSMLDISGGHYKRQLRKALALLQDHQIQLAHEREAAPSQALLRQLRDQLEDAETAKTSALKSRHNLESELNEIRMQLEQALVAKAQAEERYVALMRQKTAGVTLIVEKDEQLQAVLKKYKLALQQNHIDHIAIGDYMEQVADLEKAKHKLEDELHDAQSQLEWCRQHTVEKHRYQLLEQKQRDTENRVELETAQKLRLESIVAKLSDEVEQLTEQLEEAVRDRDKAADHTSKIRKEVIQLQETIEEHKKREIDQSAKSKSNRAETDQLEDKTRYLQNELKVAQRRIEQLQAALTDGLGDDPDDEDLDFDDSRTTATN